MFIKEVVTGSIRAQTSRLKNLVEQLELDNNWQEQSSYYASELQIVEKSLRGLRKMEFEPVYKSN